MLYFSIPLLVLGGLMVLRGAIYGLWPEGATAKKRQQQNLRKGFTTDMAAFGKRVRRLGGLMVLIALTLIGWPRAAAADAALSEDASVEAQGDVGAKR